LAQGVFVEFLHEAGGTFLCGHRGFFFEVTHLIALGLHCFAQEMRCFRSARVRGAGHSDRVASLAARQRRTVAALGIQRRLRTLRRIVWNGLGERWQTTHGQQHNARVDSTGHRRGNGFQFS
jgi:hypothetical protein